MVLRPRQVTRLLLGSKPKRDRRRSPATRRAATPPSESFTFAKSRFATNRPSSPSHEVARAIRASWSPT
jgi:hypothetical protein